MKYFDIFNSPPSLYIFNSSKAKNNVSGFSSFLFLLSMLSVTIYYFYRYFSKEDYNLQYYRVNWTSQFYDIREKIDVQKNVYFYIENLSKYNPKIYAYLVDRRNKYTPFEKCETEDDYCFKLSFYHLKKEGNVAFYLQCAENCLDENGNPLALKIEIYFRNFYLDHESDNPLIFSKKNLYGDIIYAQTSSKYMNYYLFEFTPIAYTTTQILSTENKEYVDIYFSSKRSNDYYYDGNNEGFFFGFNLVVATHAEVYKREYISLLDIISKIGGLFSTFRLGFSLLVMIYSEYANNYDLSKDIIKKKYKYLTYLKNNNKLDNIIENELEDNIENKINNISK